MSLRTRAIARAAAFRAHLLAAEGHIADGVGLAEGEGLPGVLDALLTLQAAVASVHANEALAAADALALAFDEPVSTFRSGGDADDKDSPEEP